MARKEMVNTRQAAQLFNVSVPTFRRVARNEGVVATKEGRENLYPRTDILRLAKHYTPRRVRSPQMQGSNPAL